MKTRNVVLAACLGLALPVLLAYNPAMASDQPADGFSIDISDTVPVTGDYTLDE